MEDKNLQNEIVEAAATKAASISNEALETKSAEINETLETKANKDDVLSLAKSIDEVKEMATKNFNIGAAKRSGSEEMLEATKAGIAAMKNDGDKFSISTKDFSAGPGTTLYQAFRDSIVTDIKYDPNYQTRLRNFVPVYGANASGVVRFNQESALTDSTATKIRGAAGTSNVQTVSPVIKPIQTIQSALTIPREDLMDIAGIDSYVNQRLIGLLMDEEDNQILTGNATAPNYEGINTSAPADQTLTTAALADAFLSDSVENSISNANNYDVLNSVAAELEGNNFRPSMCILNPVDFRHLGTIKSNQSEYVLNQAVTNGRMAWYFMGLEIVPSSAQAAGTFTVYDKMALGYHVNQGVTFEYGYNTDDFISNNITAKAIVRGAQVTYRPNGIVTGTLSVLRLALASA